MCGFNKIKRFNKPVFFLHCLSCKVFEGLCSYLTIYSVSLRAKKDDFLDTNLHIVVSSNESSYGYWIGSTWTLIDVILSYLTQGSCQKMTSLIV